MAGPPNVKFAQSLRYKWHR